MTREKILNLLYPIRLLVDYESPKKNVTCPNPKHVDKKPSAHIYNNRIWCFVCERHFYVTDIIKYEGLNSDELYQDLQNIYQNQNLEELAKEAAQIFSNNKTQRKTERRTDIIRKPGESFEHFLERYYSCW